MATISTAAVAGVSSVPGAVDPVVEECARQLSRLELPASFGLPAEEDVTAALTEASRLGRPSLVWRARVLQAQGLAWRGDVEAALPVLADAEAFAVAAGEGNLLARVHLVLSWTYRDVGDLDAYLHHAVLSAELLPEDAPGGVRSLHLYRLADALDECGSWAEAVHLYDEAERVAGDAGDAVRRVTALNNRAYGEYEAGLLHDSLRTIDRLLAVCGAAGLPVQGHVWDTRARVYLAMGRLAEAREESLRAIDSLPGQRAPQLDAAAEWLLTLSTTARLLGDHEAAQRSIDESRTRAERSRMRRVLVRAQSEQAQLFAARGEYRAAYEAHRAFHAAERQLLSEKRATQVRLRQVVLDTERAKEAAERFRAEAHRDALTGLPNRRAADLGLQRLAQRATECAVVIAIVDIDCFKGINDALSHATGDEVLVAVAHLLEGGVRRAPRPRPQEGFAARLGGEEFVVALSGERTDEILDRLEQLVDDVRRHDWTALTGALPVTISVGATQVLVGEDSSSALRRADQHLYRAKRAGRDRLCSDECAD